MKIFLKTAFIIIAAVIPFLLSAGAFAESTDIPPIQVGGYTQFTGENQPEDYANYYVEDVVKLESGNSFTLPETSVLTVRKGGELQIFVGAALNIQGKFVVEQGARVVVSGQFRAEEKSQIDCFGEFASTKKSTVLLAGEFCCNESAKTVFNGNVNIYKTCVYKNIGITCFAHNAQATLSGKYEIPESGKLLIKGTLSTTINARIAVEGYIYLSGKILNTGEITLGEKSVSFFGDGQFVSGKTGRLFDKRTANTDDKSGENIASSGNNDNSKKYLRGIDVSYWQGAIEWDKVSAAGIDFAFVRASVGDYYTDETLYYNITEAQRVGIKVGAYHFCRADSVESARAEAKLFLEAIKPYKFDFPVVVDIEDSRHEKLSVEQLTQITAVFCEEIKKAGYQPMIYSSASWLNHKLDTKKLSEYDIWVAHWGTKKPAYSGDYTVWQYSCKGIVSGINGGVDLNIAYKNYS